MSRYTSTDMQWGALRVDWDAGSLRSICIHCSRSTTQGSYEGNAFEAVAPAHEDTCPLYVPEVPPEPEDTGWTDVTPAGWDDDVDIGGANNNYGWQQVLWNPTNSQEAWALCCYQGCWHSTDGGKTWTRVDVNGDLGGGRPWAASISNDGTQMWAANGYGPAYKKMLTSVNGGVTWTHANATDFGASPYSITKDPTDSDHQWATMQSPESALLETFDGWATFSVRGDLPTGPNGFVYAIGTTGALLVVAEGDASNGSDSVYRGAWNGSAWVWTAVSQLRHNHGTHCLGYDAVNDVYYLGGASGIERSDDDCVTFESVASGQSGTIVVVGGAVLSAASYAVTGEFSSGPNIRTAPLPAGDTFSGMADPAGMDNGPFMAAASVNATSQPIAVFPCWRDGLYRYVGVAA